MRPQGLQLLKKFHGGDVPIIETADGAPPGHPRPPTQAPVDAGKAVA